MYYTGVEDNSYAKKSFMKNATLIYDIPKKRIGLLNYPDSRKKALGISVS